MPNPARTVHILAMRHDRAWLIGPFATHDAAVDWVRANNPSSDPRWRIIRLSPDRLGRPLQCLCPDTAGLNMDQMAEVV